MDDYAFSVWGLMELYKASFEPNYLRKALDLNDIMVRDFWDEGNGGLYFTSADATDLSIRPKRAVMALSL